MNYSVSIYGKKNCPYTINAIDLVKSNNLACEVIYLQKQTTPSVTVSHLKLNKLIPKSSNHSTVPKIFFCYPDNTIKFVGGYTQLAKLLN